MTGIKIIIFLLKSRNLFLYGAISKSYILIGSREVGKELNISLI